jgi:outer membrane protein assembly factor BamB
MEPTIRLHIFLPTDEDGEEIPPTIELEDEYALEETFSKYFVRSGYGFIRSEGPEIVSVVFEDRPDNIELVSELETECQRLYPEADVLRVRDDNNRDDGPAWEYGEDIIIWVGNLGNENPTIRWQYGEDIYGLEKSPAIGTADGTIPLTDGKTLWGVTTDTGAIQWSTELKNMTARNPLLVGKTIIIEGKNALWGYAIEDGRQTWMCQDTKLSNLTARPVSVDSGCYLGNVDGAVCHISPEGELHLICEIDSRVETICIDERHIYALTREPGQSGTMPDTVQAIDRETEMVRWTFTPGDQLNRYVVSGSEKVFLSTTEQIVALNAATGDMTWKLDAATSEEAELDSKEDESTSDQSDDGAEEHLSYSEPDSISSDIEWNTKEYYGNTGGDLYKSDTSKLRLSTQPLFNEYLYAPTNEGVLKIEPDTGEVLWRTRPEGNEESGGVWPRDTSTSQPTSDGTLLYFGSGDVVYAIELDDGGIKWKFETPGSPGAITYCDTSESVTFVTRGLAVNVDTAKR